jgi:hypothetical protein
VDAPQLWLRDTQAVGTLDAVNPRCLDFMELPARRLVVYLRQCDSAIQRHATHNPRWLYIESVKRQGFVVGGMSAQAQGAIGRSETSELVTF